MDIPSDITPIGGVFSVPNVLGSKRTTPNSETPVVQGPKDAFIRSPEEGFTTSQEAIDARELTQRAVDKLKKFTGQ